MLINRPFHSCGLTDSQPLSEREFEVDPCFDTNLRPFLMEIMPKNTTYHKNNMIYIMKQEGLF